MAPSCSVHLRSHFKAFHARRMLDVTKLKRHGLDRAGEGEQAGHGAPCWRFREKGLPLTGPRYRTSSISLGRQVLSKNGCSGP